MKKAEGGGRRTEEKMNVEVSEDSDIEHRTSNGERPRADVGSQKRTEIRKGQRLEVDEVR
jgi:hypothetical protein